MQYVIAADYSTSPIELIDFLAPGLAFRLGALVLEGFGRRRQGLADGLGQGERT